LWPALLSGGPSPRTEVVHQVSNQYYNALTGVSTVNGSAVSKGNGDGCLSMAIRMDNWKLIVGDPGDDRFVKWPEPDTARHAFGSSGGGEREPGTDHCRAPSGHTQGCECSRSLCVFFRSLTKKRAAQTTAREIGCLT